MGSGITLKLFADDAKLYSIIHTNVCSENLQSCLNAVFAWSHLLINNNNTHF